MARRRDGFTLIELMVVMALLSIGLLAVSALFVCGIVSNTKARCIQIAADRVQRETERLRSVGFDSITVNNASLFPPTAGYTMESQDEHGMGTLSFTEPSLPGSQGTIAIDYYDGGSGYLLTCKQIIVTLSWSGARRARGTVTTVLLIANRPT